MQLYTLCVNSLLTFMQLYTLYKNSWLTSNFYAIVHTLRKFMSSFYVILHTLRKFMSNVYKPLSLHILSKSMCYFYAKIFKNGLKPTLRKFTHFA